MGTQIITDAHEVCFSSGAWEVVYLTIPFHPNAGEVRDWHKGPLYDDGIPNSCFIKADQEVPLHYKDYLKYIADKRIPVLDEDEFDQIRRFIHEVAESGLNAKVLY